MGLDENFTYMFLLLCMHEMEVDEGFSQNVTTVTSLCVHSFKVIW